MKKLFLLLTAVLLSAGMVVQAQESLLPDDSEDLVQGRNNAPQATQASYSQYFQYKDLINTTATTVYYGDNTFILEAMKSNGDYVSLFFNREGDSYYGFFNCESEKDAPQAYYDSEYDGYYIDGPFPGTYSFKRPTYYGNYCVWEVPTNTISMLAYNLVYAGGCGGTIETANYCKIRISGTVYKFKNTGSVIVTENNVGGLFVESSGAKDLDGTNNISFTIGNRNEYTVNLGSGTMTLNSASSMTMAATSGSNSASLRLNSLSTGSYSKSDFDLSNCSFRYNGSNKTILDISAEVTASNGVYTMVATIRDNSQNVYFVTLTAPIKYYVAFNGNGSTSGSMSNQTHTYGTSLALTSNSYNKTNYSFSGWATTAEGSVVYTDGESVSNLTQTNGGIVTLYAKWTAGSCTYDVEFDANGGSGTMANQEFTCGEAQPLNPNAFTGPAATITYNYHGATSGNGTPSVTVNKPFGVWEGPDEDVDDEAEVNFSASNGGTITLIATWNAFPSVTLPTPEKTGYTFNGWYTEETGGTKKGEGGASFNPAGNITLHAQWTINTYTVSIVSNNNEYGTVSQASVASVPYGTVITTGTGANANKVTINGTTVTATPATATAQYTYAFDGWTNGTATVTGNTTVTATFTRTVNQYTVTWKSEDGLSTLETDADQNYGTATAFNGSTPTKDATAQYTYTFDGWATEANGAKVYNNNETPAVSGAATYYAHFSATTRTYTVSIASNNNEYGTVSPTSVASVPYGTVITTSTNTVNVNGTTVTATKHADDAQYTYTFDGWTNGTATVTGDLTVTANFTRTTNTYTILWKNGEVVLETDENVAYGTTPTYNGSTPTKEADSEYTYAFNGWSPAVATVTTDATYTAAYSQTKVQYTLTWNFDGGTTATAEGNYTHGLIDWGTAITAPANPTKDGYTFNGWNTTPAATMPAANVTYTAQWISAAPPVVLLDNEPNTHYNTFKTTYHEAKGVTVTYARQFTEGRWSTLCLPFNVNKAMFSNLNFGSRIYEFKYATGNADDGVNLYFSIAKSIEAGKGYIVNADAKLAARTSFTFSGVTMDLSADSVAELNSVTAYDKLAGNSSEGNIELVGTLRKGTLKGTVKDNRYMGLKENKIYYPNITTGSTILAYRGIFRSKKGTLNAERIRIIVDGEEKAELEIINGELQDVQETKKFIENGVLYIERNGIIYDATGRKVE